LNDLSEMNAYILTGGESSRMKQDKALLQLGGKRFIDIIVEQTAPLFMGVYLVGKPHSVREVEGCISDKVKGFGPIGGVYTALLHTTTEYNFILGIDYPGITSDVIKLLHSLASPTLPPCDAFIPVTPDGPHPLLGFYSKSCVFAVRRCISEKCLRIRCIEKYSPVCYTELVPVLGEKKFKKIFPSFLNVNSEDDLLKINHLNLIQKKQ